MLHFTIAAHRPPSQQTHVIQFQLNAILVPDSQSNSYYYHLLVVIWFSEREMGKVNVEQIEERKCSKKKSSKKIEENLTRKVDFCTARTIARFIASNLLNFQRNCSWSLPKNLSEPYFLNKMLSATLRFGSTFFKRVFSSRKSHKSSRRIFFHYSKSLIPQEWSRLLLALACLLPYIICFTASIRTSDTISGNVACDFDWIRWLCMKIILFSRLIRCFVANFCISFTTYFVTYISWNNDMLCV